MKNFYFTCKNHRCEVWVVAVSFHRYVRPNSTSNPKKGSLSRVHYVGSGTGGKDPVAERVSRKQEDRGLEVTKDVTVLANHQGQRKSEWLDVYSV